MRSAPSTPGAAIPRRSGARGAPRDAGAPGPNSAVLALPIDELHGITPSMVRTLRAADFATIGAVLSAKRATLLELRSFGPSRVQRIRDAARRVVADAKGLPSIAGTPAEDETALALRQPFVATVASEPDALEARDRMVVGRTHFAAAAGGSLQTLSQEDGVSRERVRQPALIAIRGISRPTGWVRVLGSH